ncbi:MAG: lipopolysaccharide kinase InaA family protein [Planctomycetota bacterium]
MPRWPVLDELPEGVVVREAGRGVLAARAEYADALLTQGFGPGGGDAPPAKDLAGRRPLGELRLGDERLVVRRFQHGGMLRWATGRRFGDPERPFRELVLAHALTGRGIATPLVIAARARRAAVGGWLLDLVTRRIEHARDFAEWLEALREGRVQPAARSTVLASVGGLLGRMHGAGLWHADLNPRNVLLEGEALEHGDARPWVIDLDRSVLSPEGAALADGARWSNLSRLLRSVLRREERGRRFLARTDYARFLAAYAGARGAAPAAWRDEAAGVLAAFRRSSSVHRVWWRIEEAFGGGAEHRDGGAVVRRRS